MMTDHKITRLIILLDIELDSCSIHADVSLVMYWPIFITQISFISIIDTPTAGTKIACIWLNLLHHVPY